MQKKNEVVWAICAFSTPPLHFGPPRSLVYTPGETGSWDWAFCPNNSVQIRAHFQWSMFTARVCY